MANKLEPQLVRVQLSVRDLQLEELHSSLQRVLDLAGCPGCGLAGLDLNIRGPIEGPQPDPWLETALVREFAGAETFGPGVVDASLEAAIVIGSQEPHAHAIVMALGNAPTAPVAAPGTRPGLAMTYEGYSPGLLERILPLVDYIEVTPDTIARGDGTDAHLDPVAMAELASIGDDARILVHGVGLTIGSHEGWSERYIRLLDSFLEQIEVVWHSEHLGYTTVDGEHLGTMLPPPRTDEVLELVCRRVEAIQARYGLPFLLENVIHLLPDYPGDYSGAGFFNAIAAQTDCDFLLDAYNLECDAHNQALDVPAYLDELNLTRVREVHVADGTEHRGYRLDIHSGLTRDVTLSIAQDVVARANGAVQVVTYELVEEAVSVLGHDAIADELTRLRRLL